MRTAALAAAYSICFVALCALGALVVLVTTTRGVCFETTVVETMAVVSRVEGAATPVTRTTSQRKCQIALRLPLQSM